MFSSGILDVGIGLIFLYLILSLLGTAVNEYIARLRNLRARTLERAIRRLLGAADEGEGLAPKFYSHPLIQSLADKSGHPSYIPSRAFAGALLDSMGLSAEGKLDAKGIRSTLEQVPECNAKQAVACLLREKAASRDELQQKVETWFDDSMDRVSGWYKRKAQSVTLVVAVALTLLVNADTLDIANRLWTNPTLRAEIVEQAKARAEQPLNVEYTDPDSPLASQAIVTPPGEMPEAHPVGLTTRDAESLGQLTGWREDFARLKSRLGEAAGGMGKLHAVFLWALGLVPLHIVGWALTAFAITLGAPFWFDLLKKAINIRSTGAAPGEKKPKAGAPASPAHA